MSFDLFVLIGKIDKNRQEKWQANLAKSGIEAIFPEAFTVDENSAEELTIQCRLHPPLVKEPTEFEAHTFHFEFDVIDPNFKAELLASTEDVSLQQLIQSIRSELQLYNQLGRSNHALIVQCFAAASLADACDGVLFDPQEHGVVKGKESYELVQTHCQYEIDQGLTTHQTHEAPESSVIAMKTVEKHLKPNEKPKKAVSIEWVILFLVVLVNFLMDK